MNNLHFLHVLMFCISTIADFFLFSCFFFLFYKILKTKKIAIENNREIFEHDREIFDIKERIKNCKKV